MREVIPGVGHDIEDIAQLVAYPRIEHGYDLRHIIRLRFVIDGVFYVFEREVAFDLPEERDDVFLDLSTLIDDLLFGGPCHDCFS